MDMVIAAFEDEMSEAQYAAYQAKVKALGNDATKEQVAAVAMESV